MTITLKKFFQHNIKGTILFTIYNDMWYYINVEKWKELKPCRVKE